ncbi:MULTISPECIES: hypothetical protein [unclassified Brevundimonas]|jgi:hypothetical protein|uniref:hypothetical protein n=1 Tax=unclassified Brevundimonas TaxID=2622653 RepID=UPI0025B88361|nr:MULTISPECIES: hypothetical protein [unclassified Brevundimonas]
MSERASEKKLDELHATVAMLLTNELSRACIRAEENPSDPNKAISPQLISQAIKFLKDNGVAASATSPRLDDLTAKLADLDLDDEVLSGMTAQ